MAYPIEKPTQPADFRKLARKLSLPLRCAECGRFVPLNDVATGPASHKLVTPESLRSRETLETLCRKHR